MPPPGGGGSHGAMFGPDHLPRGVREIGMMDYGTLGMKYGTVDHTTVDYWMWLISGLVARCGRQSTRMPPTFW